MQEWIERLVREKYRTYGALAHAIGMTDSGFGRAVRAGTFDLENLLLLASETGESPATVLRLAGKTEVNELIEKLYGTARAPRNPDAQKAYDLMEGIAFPNTRESILQLMREAQELTKQMRAQQERLNPVAPVRATHKSKQSAR